MEQNLIERLLLTDKVKDCNEIIIKILENPSEDISKRISKELDIITKRFKNDEQYEITNIHATLMLLIIAYELDLKDTFDSILSYSSLDNMSIDLDLGFFVLEDFSNIIIRLGRNQEDKIIEFVKNGKLDKRMRLAYSIGILNLALNGFCDLEKAKLFYKELLLNKGFKELKEVAEFSLKKLEENNEIKFNGKFESLFHVLEELERDDEYDYFDELDAVDYYENLPLENDLDKHWREGINQEEWDYFEFNEPREVVKIGRNDPCPCGSGKKYKKCCGK